MSNRIIRMVDVEDGESKKYSDTEYKEFIMFWAEHYPDKVRKPEYFYKYMEWRNDKKRSERAR